MKLTQYIQQFLEPMSPTGSHPRKHDTDENRRYNNVYDNVHALLQHLLESMVILEQEFEGKLNPYVLQEKTDSDKALVARFNRAIENIRRQLFADQKKLDAALLKDGVVNDKDTVALIRFVDSNVSQMLYKAGRFEQAFLDTDDFKNQAKDKATYFTDATHAPTVNMQVQQQTTVTHEVTPARYEDRPVLDDEGHPVMEEQVNEQGETIQVQKTQRVLVAQAVTETVNGVEMVDQAVPYDYQNHTTDEEKRAHQLMFNHIVLNKLSDTVVALQTELSNYQLAAKESAIKATHAQEYKAYVDRIRTLEVSVSDLTLAVTGQTLQLTKAEPNTADLEQVANALADHINQHKALMVQVYGAFTRENDKLPVIVHGYVGGSEDKRMASLLTRKLTSINDALVKDAARLAEAVLALPENADLKEGVLKTLKTAHQLHNANGNPITHRDEYEAFLKRLEKLDKKPALTVAGSAEAVKAPFQKAIDNAHAKASDLKKAKKGIAVAGYEDAFSDLKAQFEAVQQIAEHINEALNRDNDPLPLVLRSYVNDGEASFTPIGRILQEKLVQKQTALKKAIEDLSKAFARTSADFAAVNSDTGAQLVDDAGPNDVAHNIYLNKELTKLSQALGSCIIQGDVPTFKGIEPEKHIAQTDPQRLLPALANLTVSAEQAKAEAKAATQAVVKKVHAVLATLVGEGQLIDEWVAPTGTRDVRKKAASLKLPAVTKAAKAKAHTERTSADHQKGARFQLGRLHQHTLAQLWARLETAPYHVNVLRALHTLFVLNDVMLSQEKALMPITPRKDLVDQAKDSHLYEYLKNEKHGPLHPGKVQGIEPAIQSIISELQAYNFDSSQPYIPILSEEELAIFEAAQAAEPADQAAEPADQPAPAAQAAEPAAQANEPAVPPVESTAQPAPVDAPAEPAAQPDEELFSDTPLPQPEVSEAERAAEQEAQRATEQEAQRQAEEEAQRQAEEAQRQAQERAAKEAADKAAEEAQRAAEETEAEADLRQPKQAQQPLVDLGPENAPAQSAQPTTVPDDLFETDFDVTFPPASASKQPAPPAPASKQPPPPAVSVGYEAPATYATVAAKVPPSALPTTAPKTSAAGMFSGKGPGPKAAPAAQKGHAPAVPPQQDPQAPATKTAANDPKQPVQQETKAAPQPSM